MTEFLVIVVIALFAITIWQMIKIFQLSKGKDAEDDSTGIATDKDNNTQGYLMLFFGIGFYIAMFYCFWEYTKFALPPAASVHGEDYDSLLLISMVVIMFVQIITQGLLHYFAYKYKGKKGNKALFFADNDKLEFVWTIIPVIVLAGLIIYGLFTWSDIMNVDEEEDPLVIEIYAKQFSFVARYAGEDNVLGKANVRFIEGANMLGIDPTDSYGFDDKITTELHLPVDRPVLFKFRSQDVLHSAYFPFFRVQMNVVPGMVTQFGFTPTITSAEMQESEYMREKVASINVIREENNNKLAAEGGELLQPYEQFEYYLLCNKICGTAHYNMQMKVIVETQEEFETWIKEQDTFGDLIEIAAE